MIRRQEPMPVKKTCKAKHRECPHCRELSVGAGTSDQYICCQCSQPALAGEGTIVRNYRARAVGKDGQPVISEKLLQEKVRQAALLNGYLYYHTFNAYRSPEGFPDCVMLNPKKRRLIIAELKSETGKLTDKQQEWIDGWMSVFSVSTADVYVFGPLRPSNFDSLWEVLSR